MSNTENIALAIENTARAFLREMPSVVDDSFDTLCPQLYDFFEKRGCKPDECAEQSVALFAMRHWRKYRAVYRFHEGFMAALKDGEEPTIRAELLRRLPFPAFMVVEGGAADNDALLVCVEVNDEGECMLISMPVNYFPDRKQNIRFQEFSIWFKDGDTIRDALQRMRERILKSSENAYGNFDAFSESYERAAADYTQYITAALLAAYYLAAQNADVKQVKTPKAKRPKRPDGAPLNIRAWDVGFRVGADIALLDRESADAADEDTTEPRRHKYATRPHLRRAHWHHYWTGRGRTKLELRWIAPTVVGMNGDELPAVLHEIGGSA